MQNEKQHQKTFNKVWNHFIVNRKPFGWGLSDANSYDRCIYRGKNDKGQLVRCAIGINIPKREYKETMEGMTANSILKRYESDAQRITPEAVNRVEKLGSVTFLSRLQNAHDGAATTSSTSSYEEFEANLRLIAKDYNLTIPESN